MLAPETQIESVPGHPSAVMPRRRGGRLLEHWPLLLASAALAATLTVLVVISLGRNDGRFVYALDDAYIHLATARNLATHGVWGVTAYQFSSATSSLIWPLLLAVGYQVTDNADLLPFALNVAFGVGLLAYVHAFLRRERAPTVGIALTLLALVFVTPMPTMATIGMEHLTHALLAVVTLTLGARYLVADDADEANDLADAGAPDDPDAAAWRGQRRRARTLLFVTLPLLTMTRYEGMFFVGALCAGAVLRRRVLDAVLFAAISFAPLAVFGLISMNHGSGFLPNSLMMKASLNQEKSFRSILNALNGDAAQQWALARKAVKLLALLAAAAVGGLVLRRVLRTAWFRPARRRFILVQALLLAATFGTHYWLAHFGWFFRYEAYLIACILVVAAQVLFELVRTAPAPGRRRTVTVVAALGVACLLLAYYRVRTFKSLKWTPMAMYDRYTEHVLTSEFIKRHYDRDTLVANDIGALCHMTNAKVLDVAGLGSFEPIAYLRSPTGFSAADLDGWAGRHNARIAVLQVQWHQVYPRIPPHWRHVANWHIPHNIVFGDTRVGFFAIDPAEEEPLRQRLVAFTKDIPDVRLELREPYPEGHVQKMLAQRKNPFR